MAIASIALTTQIGCYNTYTISKSELAKLESSVERVEVVEVLADCPTTPVASDGEGQTEPHGEGSTDGCTRVPVSTVNAVSVLIEDGSRRRVTPFNFVMDDVQLVSPEYNLLVQLDQVQGAQVQEFSTWKTVATIAGIGLLSVGTFVGIGLLAPDEKGFN